MLKIKCEKNKLVLFREGTFLSFELFDKQFYQVIEKNINSLNKNGCFVSIEKKSDRRNYLILSTDVPYKFGSNGKEYTSKSLKIVIPDSISYEISSRMILLNTSLKVPKRVDE